MAYGVEQQIGIGQAQVLPQGANPMALVQQLNRQKAYKDETDRYNQQVAKQEEKDLYGIVGDALNLRDFNPVIHEQVRKGKTDLAKKLMTEKPSLAEAHMMAQNYAQELGIVSDQFNQVDKYIADSKKEYDGDKAINLGNIEALTRKKVIDQYKATGKVDTSINPFDEVMMENSELSLTGKGNHLDIDFKNVLKQTPKGGYKRVNKNRGYDEMDWDVETYPDYYDFKPGDEGNAPTISTKSEASGLKDDAGNDIPMLSESAMDLVTAKTSNKLKLFNRVKEKYPDIDLKSGEAEKLMRIEAYKDVNEKIPLISSKPKTAANPVMSHSFNFGSGFGQQGGAGQTKGNAFDDFPNEDHGTFKIQDGTFFEADGSLKQGKLFIKGDRIPSTIKTALNAGGIDPKLLISGVDAILKDGKIVSMSNKPIGVVTRQAMEGVFQPKADTEPLKGEKLQFAPNQQPKGGSYSNQQPATYKGKKINVGVKNGKWYNTATGEEIK